MAPVTFIRF